MERVQLRRQRRGLLTPPNRNLQRLGCVQRLCRTAVRTIRRLALACRFRPTPAPADLKPLTNSSSAVSQGISKDRTRIPPKPSVHISLDRTRKGQQISGNKQGPIPKEITSNNEKRNASSFGKQQCTDASTPRTPTDMPTSKNTTTPRDENKPQCCVEKEGIMTRKEPGQDKAIQTHIMSESNPSQMTAASEKAPMSKIASTQYTRPFFAEKSTCASQTVPNSTTVATQSTGPSLTYTSNQDACYPLEDKDSLTRLSTDELSQKMVDLVSHNIGLSREQTLIHSNIIKSRIVELLSDVRHLADEFSHRRDDNIIVNENCVGRDNDNSSVDIAHELSDAINDCSSDEVYVDAEELPSTRPDSVSLQSSDMELVIDLEEAMADMDLLSDTVDVNSGISDELNEAMCDIEEISQKTSQYVSPVAEPIETNKLSSFEEPIVIPLPGMVRLKHSISMPWFILLDHDMASKDQFNQEVRQTKSLQTLSMEVYDFDPDEEIQFGTAFMESVKHNQLEQETPSIGLGNVKKKVCTERKIPYQPKLQSVGNSKNALSVEVCEEYGPSKDLIEECLLEVEQTGPSQLQDVIPNCFDDYILTSSKERIENENSQQQDSFGEASAPRCKPVAVSNEENEVSSESSAESFAHVKINGTVSNSSWDIGMLTSSDEDMHISPKSSREIFSHVNIDRARGKAETKQREHPPLPHDSTQVNGRSREWEECSPFIIQTTSYQPEISSEDKYMVIGKKKSREIFGQVQIDSVQHDAKTSQQPCAEQQNNCYTDFERVVMCAEENHLKVVTNTSVEMLSSALLPPVAGKTEQLNSGQNSGGKTRFSALERGSSKEDVMHTRKTSRERFGHVKIDACIKGSTNFRHKGKQSAKGDKSAKSPQMGSQWASQVNKLNISPHSEENPTFSAENKHKQKFSEARTRPGPSHRTTSMVTNTSEERLSSALLPSVAGKTEQLNSGQNSFNALERRTSKEDVMHARKTSRERFGHVKIDSCLKGSTNFRHKGKQSSIVEKSAKSHHTASQWSSGVNKLHISPHSEQNPSLSVENKHKEKFDDDSNHPGPSHRYSLIDETGSGQLRDESHIHVRCAEHKVTFIEGYELPMDVHYGLHDKENYPIRSLLRTPSSDENQLLDTERKPPSEPPDSVMGRDGFAYPFITVPVVPLTRIHWDKTDKGANVLLGTGSYGYCEAARYTTPGGSVIQVCVKQCTELIDQLILLREGRFAHYLNSIGVFPEFHGYVYLLRDSELVAGLVSEMFAEGKTLSALLRNHRFVLPDEDWIAICIQLAKGLQKIHECDVLFNDVKGNNILVDVNNEGQPIVKFIDLGMASYKSGIVRHFNEEDVREVRHLAPEVKTSHTTTKFSDIWGLGALYWDIYEKAQISGLDDISKTALVTSPWKRSSLDVILELLEDVANKGF